MNSDATLSPALSFLGPDLSSTIVSVSSAGSDDPREVARLASRLPHLRSLAIQDAPLSDRDLHYIVGLSELNGLYLRGTAITDQSVEVLSGLAHLEVLNLHNTDLSSAAIKSIRKALPSTRIHSGPTSGGFM